MKVSEINILSQQEDMDNLLQSFLSNEFELPSKIIKDESELENLAGSEGVLIYHVSQLASQVLRDHLNQGSFQYNICLGDPGGIADVPFVPLPLKITNLVMEMSSQYDMSSKVESAGNKYFPVPLTIFNRLQSTPCDVFIRLGKSEVDFRYVKRLYANHSFEQGEIKKFGERGVVNFYVLTPNRELFLDFVVSKIDVQKPKVAKVQKNEDEEEKSFIDINADLHNIVTELALKSKINAKVVELANQNIKKMASTVQSSKKLSSLLKDLLQAKGSFNYKHCFLNTILSYEVMKRTELGKTSRLAERHEMMSFVAFYHDILLKDEKFCRIRNKKEFYRAAEQMNENEKTLVSQHAKLIADMLGEIRGTPAEASQVLRTHHGMTNGIGFASSYNASLPSFSILFIVVEFFVFQLLDPTQNGGKIENIFSICEEEFTLPSYRKMLDVLKEIFNLTA